MNLLRETLDALKENNKTPADVIWVGSPDARFTWEKFVDVADFDYDEGFGGQHIARDLLVVGNDFWLERYEYDGSECWDFKQMPKMPTERLDVKRVGGDEYMWATLEEIQQEGGRTNWRKHNELQRKD